MLFQNRKFRESVFHLLIIAAFMMVFPAVSAAENFELAAESSVKSVIYISVFQKIATENGPKYSKIGYGSGTIITRSGYIITNNHVVRGGDYFKAMLYDGTECIFEKIRGKYYISDQSTDLSVMKLKNSPGSEFVPLPVESSASLRAGQWVIAVGSPYGLKNSITSGVISSVGRYDVGFAEIEDFIQTDVPINPGNSGGPLVNSDGRMIGINTAIRTVSGGYQGISFAIPSDMVVRIFNDILAFGKVKRGWLGLFVKNESTENGSANYDVRIVSVIDNSPAKNAGLKEGDIVREIDGEIINSKGEMLKIVKSIQVGKTIEMIVDRNHTIRKFRIGLVEKSSYARFGKTIEILSDRYGLEFGFDSAKGLVVVTGVSPFRIDTHGGRFFSGDMIVSVNGVSVRSIEQFYNVVEKSSCNIYSVEIMRDENIMRFGFND